jgi:hypothetical protein
MRLSWVMCETCSSEQLIQFSLRGNEFKSSISVTTTMPADYSNFFCNFGGLLEEQTDLDN